MNTIYESTIADDVYDIIFKNTMHETMDFCEVFDESYVDNANACIYLSSGNQQFKIKIERV
jgi:hypothetical protein